MSRNRRQFLAAVGGTAGIPAFSAQEGDQRDCEERIRELESRIESLRAELENKEQMIDQLQTQEYEYTKQIHEEAEEAGKRLRDAVVSVELDYVGGSSGATGWFIEENRILTNEHVISGVINQDADLYVWDINQNRVEATIEKIADSADLALLETSDSAPYVPPLADLEDVEQGDKLVRVGNPFLIGYWAMGLGELLSKDRRPDRRLFAELPYGGGHSGSPVINLDGEVIGISFGTSERGRDFKRPDEPPTPIPPNLKPNYDHEPKAEVFNVGIDYIKNWMPQ